MEKGKKYLPYCANDLQNLIDTLWIILYELNNDNKIEICKQVTEANSAIERLRSKIEDLDNINNMKP